MGSIEREDLLVLSSLLHDDYWRRHQRNRQKCDCTARFGSAKSLLDLN